MIDSKPYGNTVKPNDMTKKQRQKNLTAFFIEQIDDIVCSKGSCPNNVFNQVMRAFDSVRMPTEESEKMIVLELTNMDLCLQDRNYYDSMQSAKKIKEVLRDCNMWTIEEA